MKSRLSYPKGDNQCLSYRTLSLTTSISKSSHKRSKRDFIKLEDKAVKIVVYHMRQIFSLCKDKDQDDE